MAEVVVHLFMAVPTNVAALGLPPFTCEPPVTSRFWEKAQLKSATPLTSQSPMSPHVVVAAALSWTHSMDEGRMRRGNDKRGRMRITNQTSQHNNELLALIGTGYTQHGVWDLVPAGKDAWDLFPLDSRTP